jgi:Tfp pilus assembly protein PilZ
MDKPQIVLEFESFDELKAEFESHLKNGGTFVKRELSVKMGDQCEVVIIHPERGEEKIFPSKVVMAVDQGDNTGIGIAFKDFGPENREELRRFIGETTERKKEDKEEDEGEDETKPREKHRYLSETERFNVIREGDLGQRIQLERRYGKLVWEILLRNPRITKMEVARIAQKAAITKPIRDLIIGNRAWLGDSQIRRALLTNPKMDDSDIMKVLRAAPKGELRALSQQGTSSPKIRRAALKLLLG